MTGFIGEDEVRRIKELVDLVQLFGDYAPPQRSGANFKCCCPFHDERTPSCVIYTDQQTYHCFGCGAHGDAITLVRDKENLEFADAVEFLARRVGTEITYQERGKPGMARSEREELLAAMAFAVDYYERILWRDEVGAEARAYLAERGLDEEVCRRFRLGWAPGRGRLVDAARRERIDRRRLEKVDLAIERDGRIVDRFFERLMFPICDRFGQPIAFSGRLLPEAERRAKEAGRGVGKYINSTDTPLYRKREVVFNLHRARKFCRDAGRVVVMEGPTDVMACDAAGICEGVAVLGTSFTDAHARALGRLMGEAGPTILLFDGDEAGRKRAVAAVATCLAVGVQCRVALLPEGRDPAETLAEEGGREVLERSLDVAVADIVHLQRELAPTPHAMDPRERVASLDRVLDALRPIDDAELRRAYLEDVAAHFGFEVRRLERRLQGERGPPPVRGADEEGREGGAPLDDERAIVCQLLVREPALRSPAFDDWGCEPVLFPSPWDRIVAILLERPEADLDALLLAEGIADEPELIAALHRWVRSDTGPSGQDLGEGETLLRDLLDGLVQRRQHRRLETIQAALVAAEREGRMEEAAGLFREQAELRRESRPL